VSDYFQRIERQLVGRVEAGVARGSRSRLRLGVVAPALSVAVVVAVVAVFLNVHGVSSPGSRAGGGIELVYQAEPTVHTPALTSAALARTIDVMRQRAEAFGMPGASFRTTGGNGITVQLPGVTNLVQAERELGTTARLEFYDWEANALTPNGKTVASQLQAQDQTAVTISQGSGSVPPGDPGAGSMSLYDAVKLASKQPAHVSSDNARLGSLYYLFGAPGSAACATAAADAHKTPSPGVHCLLSGPDDNQEDLLSGLPSGVSASQAQQLVVPPGTVVLQASDPSTKQQTNPNDPTAQFYVLKDHVSQFGNEITNPQRSTDQSGSPDVTFGFTSSGGSKFQKVTEQIARRGELDSIGSTTLNQHFAVALDNKLVTVPQIDFHQYPDGITGGNGADITDGFTSQSAQDLATELRLGALPVNLRLILAKRLSVHG
jgi:SecD/SecF fusion protein